MRCQCPRDGCVFRRQLLENQNESCRFISNFMSSPSSSSSPKLAKKNLVTPLLEQLFPTPVSFFARTNATSDDVVPLCLHCLMVEAGCSPRYSKDSRPPVSWNKHPDEWIIEYRHGDAANGTLRLHCSLQRRTGRLFVHAQELVDDPEPARSHGTDQDVSTRNIQVLGLQLTNYTKLANDDAGGSWSDYVRNERTLKEMFRQFIVKPLLEASGRKALEGLREEGRGMELYQEASVDLHNGGLQEGQVACKATKPGETSGSNDGAQPDARDGDGDIMPLHDADDAAEDAADSHAPSQSQDPDLFSPEPGYSYSLYSSYSTHASYADGSSFYVGLAAAIGMACVVGWWTLRTRKG